jgi:hypothetical protein
MLGSPDARLQHSAIASNRRRTPQCRRGAPRHEAVLRPALSLRPEPSARSAVSQAGNGRHLQCWELVDVAKRYSTFAAVLLIIGFGLIGYMGARLSDRTVLREAAPGTPPAISTAQDRIAAAPPELTGTTLMRTKPAAPPTTEAPPGAVPPPGVREEKTTADPQTANSGPQEPQSPPVVLLNPGSAGPSGEQPTDPGTAAAPREHANDPRPDGRTQRKNERAAAAPSETPIDETQIENRRGKYSRKQHSRDRQAVFERESPSRRRYARNYGEERGYQPPRGGPMLPFLPFLLPF